MAKVFSFRLQPVLDYRKKKEEQKIKRLSEAKLVLLQIEQAIESHKGTQRDFEESFFRYQKAEVLDSDELVRNASYGHVLQERLKRLKLLAKEASGEVEKRRNDLLETSKDKKLLENLKTKKLEDYQKALLIEEQKFLDEYAAIAYVRDARKQGDKLA